MLGFDRAMADPELLEVATESERHAEDGDAASLGALVSSWLGLTSEEPAVLQLSDDGAGKERSGGVPAGQPGRHQLSEITELPEIPEQPEETLSEETPAAGAAPTQTSTAEKSPATSPTDSATSPTFRERLASLFSRLQAPSAVSPSVIELPLGERPGPGPGSTDRRASAVSSLSLDETDAAIPPPSYTLGRPDPILLNPGLLPMLESAEPPQSSPEKRRRSGVTAAPVHGLLEQHQLKHSQYRVRRGRAAGGSGWGRADDAGRF